MGLIGNYALDSKVSFEYSIVATGVISHNKDHASIQKNDLIAFLIF